MYKPAAPNLAVYAGARHQGATDGSTTPRTKAKHKTSRGQDSVDAMLQGFVTPLSSPARSGTDHGFPLDDLERMGAMRGMKRLRGRSVVNARVETENDEAELGELSSSTSLEAMGHGTSHRREGVETRAAVSKPPTPHSMPRGRNGLMQLRAPDANYPLEEGDRALSTGNQLFCGNDCLVLLTTSFEHVGVMVGRLQHFNLLTTRQDQAHKASRPHTSRAKMVSLDAVMQCNKQALDICSRTLDCNFCSTQHACVLLVSRLVSKIAVLVDQACRDLKLCFGHQEYDPATDDIGAAVCGSVRTRLEQPLLLGQYTINTWSEWRAVMGPLVLLQARELGALLKRLTETEGLDREDMIASAMQSTNKSIATVSQLL